MSVPEPKRYVPTPTGYLMVLRQGDDAFARLSSLMREEAISSATILGFGFAGSVTFGFFDFETGNFRPRTMENLELTNLTGSLAWKDGEPSIHAHATGSDYSFKAFGGHLLALQIGRGSLELSVTLMPMHLERRLDPAIGANVLQLT